MTVGIPPAPTIQSPIATVSEVQVMTREAQEGVAREFVHGSWGEAKMASIEHNELASAVYVAIWTHLKAYPEQGRAFSDGLTYVLEGTPDEIYSSRLPDVSVMSIEQRQGVQNPKGFAYFAPIIAVEVVSPSETPKILRDKVADYLTYGTREIWVIYPDAQEIILHLADRSTRAYGMGDTLTSNVLPNFSLPLQELFGQG